MISVREIPDPETYDRFEDGLLLPIPTEETNGIVLEPRDGRNVRQVATKDILVSLGGKQVGKVENVRIDLYITDARVALACSKYDKGGGWLGSPGAMVLLNAGSMALAAIRRRGKMLVGQVRYPWLTGVGSTSKFGWLTEESLTLGAGAPQGRMYLRVTLHKGEDAAGLTAEIARRAAAYRLASEPGLDYEVRGDLERLARVKRLEPDPAKQYAVMGHDLPSPWIMGEESARLMPGGGAEPGADLYAFSGSDVRSERRVAEAVGEVRPAPARSALAASVAARGGSALAPSGRGSRFCGRCGQSLDEGALFCGKCGARVGAG
jgi:hypothetical protein